MATALITGASTGLGADFARILASMKYDLILVARNKERLDALGKALEQEHGVRCQSIQSDLSLPGASEALFHAVQSKGASVEILINNAGCGQWGAFAHSNAQDLRAMVNLNINALTELTRLFVEEMLKNKKGRILNIASTAAFQPGPWMAAYYASKAYVLSLGEALSEELKGTSVSVSTLCPGPTKTEFFDRAKMGDSRLKNMFFADSRSCAQKGIAGMMQGKVLIIDGVMNWVLTQSGRFMPRFATRRVAGLMNASSE